MKSKFIKCNSLFISSVLMLLFVGATHSSWAQGNKKPWSVPDKAKTQKNPVKSDEANLATGKSIWAKQCKSCHGAKGLGDGSKSKELESPVGDFSKDLKGQTDGELFYKTKEGRDEMPSFAKKIPDDNDIWTLVNYMRSLSGEKKSESNTTTSGNSTTVSSTTTTATTSTNTTDKTKKDNSNTENNPVKEKTNPVKKDTASTIVPDVKNNQDKPYAVYELGHSKVIVWKRSSIEQKSETENLYFEVKKIESGKEESWTTGKFSEAEIMQLKTLLDKTILEELGRKVTE